MTDLRFALRSYGRQPLLTLVAILSLGIGIGANTTVFSWMNSFVLEPLPQVPRFSRLVAVNTRGPSDAEWSMAYPALRDWRAEARTADIAAANFVQLGLRGEGGETERAWGVLASGNYFDVLGVRPALGRLLTMRDELERSPVAVLGHGYWQRRFAGDSAIVGRRLTLNGVDLTVVGIAPPRFGGTIVGLQMDLYAPVTLQPLLDGPQDILADRGWQWLDGFARLKNGVTLEQARAEIDALAGRIEAAAGSTQNLGAIVKPLKEQGAPSFLGPVFIAMLGITGVVLLIACANVANLLLARAVARRREIGIRIALGADRRRLVRQLLTESFGLALCAGLVGVLISFWGRDLVMNMAPPAPFPIGMEMTTSPRVLLFALLVTLATALIFGLVPALQASRPELVPALKDEIGGGPASRGRLQSGLIVAQIALSLVSLVCAGLFIRTVQASRSADVGFRGPDRVLLVSTELSLAGIPDSLHGTVTSRLLEEVRALPGVEAASAANNVPLGFGGESSRSIAIEGYEPQPDENMSVRYTVTGPDYFRAMDIPIVQGRGFTTDDAPGAPLAVVVNERFAERFWPGKDPVGRHITRGRREYTVVGVAKQGKYNSLTESPRAMVFHALLQEPRANITLHVRGAGDPKALTAAIRGAFERVNGNLPFLDVRTMAEHMQAAVFAQRLGAVMLAGFGAVALLLSAIGIYGVMSYGVSQRTREIGVRVALGAARGDVIGLVVQRAMRLAVLGLVIGLAAALGAGQLLRSQLIGVGPRDPLTFTVIALLLGAVAFFASWIPARRAARVDPLTALRSQ